MKTKKTKILPHLSGVILSVIGMFLFLEWLYPIPMIGTTETIAPFVMYTIYCFLLSSLQLRGLGFLLKAFGLLFLLNTLYLDVSLLSFGLFDAIAQEFALNLPLLLKLEISELTPFFRSAVSLVFIWLMSYLLYYWFVQMRRFLFFIVLTVLYVTILDTFTVYDATYAIIRIFLFAIIGLTFANLTRELRDEAIIYQAQKRSFRWIGMLLVTVLFSLFVGIVAPKYEPQWPDPVPFIESASENLIGSGVERVQKVGYGEDDSELGGSFIQDDIPVFRAEVFENHYWRIEVKDYYTGKGWEMATNPVYLRQQDNVINIDTFYSTVETEELIATVRFNEDELMRKLVYPYGVKSVAPNRVDTSFYVERSTDAVEVMENNSVISLPAYQLIYDQPSFSVDDLLNSSELAPDVLQPYLQLPDTLPSRVGVLAEEITAPYETRYEKVKAIEQYFNQNDFSYQTTDVAVPGEADDYVDQFLFETQVGYCDNFSTSMVVMLRTLDIPARWAKGFTSGELIEPRDERGLALYEITNSNAHSWVEVFFPESGWVPFEPTQGFSNPTEFYSETGDVLDDEAADLPEEMPAPEEDVQEEEVAARADDSESESLAEQSGKFLSFFIVFGILFLVSYFVYRFRFKLQANWYKLKLERKPSEQEFQAAYHFLLRLLENEGHHRPENKTLRAYAITIDDVYGTREMRKLTHLYEEMIYRKTFASDDMHAYTEIWKKFVKNILGS